MDILTTFRRSPRSGDAVRRAGLTILELLVVLAIGAIVLSLTLPSARRLKDGWAVTAAREAVVGMVERTRTEALESGGAALTLDPVGDSLWVVTGDGSVVSLDLVADFDVDLEPGDRPVELAFGPLGIGLLTSRTLRLTRGGARRSLTVSSYGRVRRW